MSLLAATNPQKKNTEIRTGKEELFGFIYKNLHLHMLVAEL